MDIGKILTAGNYSIRSTYNQLRGEFPKLTWRRMICNNQGSPKWIFILYLALQNRLYTKDRLRKWGMQVTPLCDQEMDEHQHLFFACIYSAGIWRKLLAWQRINWQIFGWKEEVDWAVQHANGKDPKAEVYRLIMAGAIYHLWMERNC